MISSEVLTECSFLCDDFVSLTLEMTMNQSISAHSDMHRDVHKDLHSEQGALSGEQPGRSRNPVIKVVDIAWLEFEKPDLTRAEAFARAFGFQTAHHGPDELQLRGTRSGGPCV